MKGFKRKIFKAFSKNFISFIVALSLIFVIFFLTNEAIILNTKHKNTIDTSFETINEQMNTVIYKSVKRESQYKVDYVSNKLRNKLLDIYQDDFDNFIKEYDESKDDSKFIKTLNDILEDENDRFFHVRNDENDIYIISPKEILADKSCRTSSKDNEERSLKEEIYKYSNPSLAKETFDCIVNGDRKDLFIQIKGSKTEITELDYKSVLKLELKELKNYEFLSISYIDEYGDIMGEKDVDKKGKKQNNRKIILVQSFNMYDQVIDLGLDKNYNVIRGINSTLIEEQELEKSLYSIIGIIAVVAFISCFLVMACLINRYIRERDKNEH